MLTLFKWGPFSLGVSFFKNKKNGRGNKIVLVKHCSFRMYSAVVFLFFFFSFVSVKLLNVIRSQPWLKLWCLVTACFNRVFDTYMSPLLLFFCNWRVPREEWYAFAHSCFFFQIIHSLVVDWGLITLRTRAQSQNSVTWSTIMQFRLLVFFFLLVLQGDASHWLKD